MRTPRRAATTGLPRRPLVAVLLVVVAALGVLTGSASGVPRVVTITGGELDPSFGTAGSVALPGGESVAVGAGNAVWVLGSVVYTTSASRYLNRFTADGRPDPSFTGPTLTSNATDLTTGPLQIDPAGGASFAVNLCCRKKQPPTSQVAVHTVSAAGQRLSGPAGTTDWPIAGLLTTPPSGTADYVIGGVVRLSDGRMRACVSVYPGGKLDPFAALVGFRANGSIDPTLGARDTSMSAPGWIKLPGLDDCGFASAGLQQLFVDGENRLYICGTASGISPIATGVLRTSADGVLDRGYGIAGRATVRATSRGYSPSTGVIDPSGVLYLGLSSRDTAGGASALATVVKLTAAGGRDGLFGSHGVSRFFPVGGSSELDTIGTLPGNRLILGLVYTSRGVRRARLSAISAGDGTPAVTFGDHGTIVSPTLTWGTAVQGTDLLTVGSKLPTDPDAPLGGTVLQRRRLG